MSLKNFMTVRAHLSLLIPNSSFLIFFCLFKKVSPKPGLFVFPRLLLSLKRIRKDIVYVDNIYLNCIEQGFYTRNSNLSNHLEKSTPFPKSFIVMFCGSTRVTLKKSFEIISAFTGSVTGVMKIFVMST